MFLTNGKAWVQSMLEGDENHHVIELNLLVWIWHWDLHTVTANYFTLKLFITEFVFCFKDVSNCPYVRKCIDCSV